MSIVVKLLASPTLGQGINLSGQLPVLLSTQVSLKRNEAFNSRDLGFFTSTCFICLFYVLEKDGFSCLCAGMLY